MSIVSVASASELWGKFVVEQDKINLMVCGI